MAFQISPGVNVTEKDLTTIIPAVATTTAGIAGYFNWGPCEKRTTVTNEDELVSVFGKPLIGNNTPSANYFFTAANYLGYGNNLQVVRKCVAGSNAVAQATGFRGDVAENFAGGTHSAVLITNDDNYYDTWLSGTTHPGAASTGISGAAESFYFASKYPGELGNSLKVSMSDTHSVVIAQAYGLSGAETDATTIAVTGGVESGSDDGVSGGVNQIWGEVAVGDTITLVNGTYTVTGFSGASAADWTNYGNGTTANHTDETAQYSHIHISPGILSTDADATNGGITATIKWAYAGNFDQEPSTSTDAANAGAVNDEVNIVVVDEDGKFSGTRGTVLERFTASKAKDARRFDGDSNYYVDVINNNSSYIWWGDHPDVLGNTSGVSGGAAGAREWGSLLSDIESGLSAAGGGKYFESLVKNFYSSMTGGSNGTFTHTALYANGYDKFADAETVDCSLLLGGPSEETTGKLLVDLATARKDCMVFLSPTRANVVGVSSASTCTSNVVDYYNNTLNKSSSYGVFDGGWKYMYDKYNDVYRWVPLNGDTAGLVTRTELTNDAWWSPAGFNRGQIRGVVKLAYEPAQANRDDLYKNNINPVVSFPGEGTILYGDKTMQRKPSAFDRINVRRLFIILEKAIATSAKYQLFEFNDEFTRAGFVNMVEPFLRDIQGRRGIQDFKVVCDETNNTGSVIDRNEFVADIYIKPARSINFIQLNFVAVGTGVSFEEVVGA